MTYTQYGKSLVVALAILTRINTFPEKWAIVSGTGKQAKIIIGYIIEHSFDNEFIEKHLEVDPAESLDRLRREKSKQRLVYKLSDNTFGEIFVLSADSTNKQRASNNLMGFGAQNVTIDDAPLIDDVSESKIFRMVTGKKDNFYMKIGNPFARNHFLKSYQDPKYFKINIDYTIGIKEGRLNESDMEEAKKKPNFSILYENKFPEAEAVDDKGWSFLITDKELENALVELPKAAWFGEKLMGVDIARGGGNFNVWVLRTSNYATQIGRNHDPDLMSTTGTTVRLGKEYEINPLNWSTDDTGVGGGVSDRLWEQKYQINSVTLGAEPDDKSRFINRRSENYWRVKQWLNQGGKLDASQDWSELLKIKFKAQDSSGKLQIMPKDEMKKYGYESPDIADALMLTFDKPPTMEDKQVVDSYLPKQSDFDPYSMIS